MTIPHLPFYFLRHGETDWNVANQIMGQQDIPLNAMGIEQARKIRSTLENVDFQAIWSSPLVRAKQTAEIINEVFHYPIYFHDNLKERGWGEGEGQTYSALHADIHPNVLQQGIKTDDIPKGAETQHQFETRIAQALKQVLSNENELPLIVGHGGFFRVLTKLLSQNARIANNCALYSLSPPISQRNSWYIVEIEG